MRKILSFIRWRIIVLRYLTIIVNIRRLSLNWFYMPVFKSANKINDLGYVFGKCILDEELITLQQIYLPRCDKVDISGLKVPFINLIERSDITVDNPLIKIAFSKEIFDVAIDYYGGNLTLDSIQVLYSWPGRDGESLKESQRWHKDYGDSKSFHAIIYLTDVNDDENGPFVFANKEDSRNISWSPLVRRIHDVQFQKELGCGKTQHYYSKAGGLVLVDPSVCYHYGSRSKTGRVAVFVTFSSSTPFVGAQPFVVENADLILAAACALRPDFSEDFLRRVIVP